MKINDEIDDLDQDSSVNGGAQRWLEVLLVFLVFFVHAGEPVPDVNEAHYLTKARHYWDPGWAAGDFFLESADAHTVFYWTFGWVTQLVPLVAAAWIGRLVTWSLMAWAWQRLSGALVPVRFMSVLSAAIFVTLTEEADLAGEWVVGGVEAKGFAYFFVLLGLERLIRNRWNAAWVLLGLASAFHVLVGGWSVLAGFVVWTRSRNRTPLVRMLPGLVGGGTVALVSLWPAVFLSYGQPAEIVAEANQIYVFQRLPHHLALLSQDMDHLLERILRHAGALLALVALVAVHTRSLRKEPRAERWERLARIRWFVIAAICITATGLSIELILQDRPALAAGILRYYWYRLGDFAVPLGVAVFAARLAELALRSRQWLTATTLLALMALPAWYLVSATKSRLDDPAPRTEQRKKIRHWSDWLQATDWIARNTPKDARFLTPRNNHTFKWRTGRAEVVTYKDIPQDARGIVEWHRRLDDVYGYTNELGERENRRSLGHHGTERILELSRTYQTEYVLTDTRRMLGLPIVYLNDTYVVYRVPSAGGEREMPGSAQ